MDDMSERALEQANRWFKSAALNRVGENFSNCVYDLEMALEIALKAVLIAMGKDYPKKHDIFDRLEEVVNENPKAFSDEFRGSISLIKGTFRQLLNVRAASVYGFDTSGNKEDFQILAERNFPVVSRLLIVCVNELKFLKG